MTKEEFEKKQEKLEIETDELSKQYTSLSEQGKVVLEQIAKNKVKINYLKELIEEETKNG